jgi:hypothetical protein
MKIIQRFQTDDGKEFTDEVEARKHELELRTLSQLKDLLKPSIDSMLVRPGNVDNVLKNILLEAPEVVKIIQSYRKRQPRDKVA